MPTSQSTPVAPDISTVPPSSPPSQTPSLPHTRRRSISRSSQGSVFRSSLGGKPISYGSMRRTGSAGGRNSVDESAFSDSEGGSETGMMRMFGSFSHTREEIRDGESINFPYQFPSNKLREDKGEFIRVGLVNTRKAIEGAVSAAQVN